MGKGRGLWVPCYRELFDHEKTERATAEFHDGLTVDLPWMASTTPLVIASCVLRLNLTLLDKLSENGRFRRPSPVKFLATVWPEFDSEACGLSQVEAGESLIHALTASGFLDVPEEGVLQVHEYEVHNARILGDRRRKRGTPTEAPRKVRGGSAAVPPPTPTPTPTPIPNESSKKPHLPEGGLGPVPLSGIAAAWTEVAKRLGTKWIRHRRIPAGEPETLVRARWKEVPDLSRWKIAMEACARDDFWNGTTATDRCPEGWKATIGSFARDKHFERFMAEAEDGDWRLAGDRDISWRLWREQRANTGEIPEGYDGAWPDDMALTPGQAKLAEAQLHAWWTENVYGKEAS